MVAFSIHRTCTCICQCHVHSHSILRMGGTMDQANMSRRHCAQASVFDSRLFGTERDLPAFPPRAPHFVWHEPPWSLVDQGRGTLSRGSLRCCRRSCPCSAMFFRHYHGWRGRRRPQDRGESIMTPGLDCAPIRQRRTRQQSSTSFTGPPTRICLWNIRARSIEQLFSMPSRPSSRGATSKRSPLL